MNTNSVVLCYIVLALAGLASLDVLTHSNLILYRDLEVGTTCGFYFATSRQTLELDAGEASD